MSAKAKVEEAGEVKMLTKQNILNQSDFESEVVSVPEWKGSIRMRVMSGEQRDEWESKIVVKTGPGGERNVDIRGLKALLIVMCAVDEAGEPLFSRGDIETINKKNSLAIDRLWQVARRMNGIGKEEIDELRKNS